MKKDLLSLAIVSGVTIVVLTGYGVWRSVVSNNSVAVIALESTLSAKEKAVSGGRPSQLTPEGIQADEEFIQGHFVLEEQVVSFINYLEEQARTQETDVEVLTVSKDGSGLRSVLTLNLTVRGTFASVMRTVGVIENGPYDLEIALLVVAQDAENSWHADIRLVAGSPPSLITTPTP